MDTVPKTLEDLQNLVERKTPESIHLDYKDSRALLNRDEIAKDVSAFANSDGGLLIYGIAEEEVDNRPVPDRLDEGIDEAKLSREQLEDIITGRINPRIGNVLIHPIPAQSGRTYYVVEVPKSYRGPHQHGSSKRYYKRFNFKSEPMEDYEIEDQRHRIERMQPLVNVDAEIRDGVWVDVVVENLGGAMAQDISFKIDPDVPDLTGEPSFLTRGIRYLPSKKRYHITYGTTLEALNPDKDHPESFSVEVSYYDPRQGLRVGEIFHLDLQNYLNTPQMRSDVRQASERIEKVLEKLIREVSSVKQVLEELTPIAGASGLELSATTVRNLHNVTAGSGEIEKIDAFRCGPDAFREVLGVSRRMALMLDRFFLYRRQRAGTLEDLDGMTPELLEKLRERFIIEDEYQEQREPAGIETDGE